MAGPRRQRAGSSAVEREVLELAQGLIRIDTSNPPGNETPAAELVRDVLLEAGVQAQLVARDPLRANVVARLPGTGEGPSLAFVGHLDVVPADARDWTHPPFAGVVDDDGYLVGRGALDMKGEVAARTVALARLAREGFRPRGDLWLIMASDEEDGRAKTGMEWLVESMPEIRTDYAVNEGGGARLKLPDGRVVHLVSVGEKGTYPAKVTALGEAGHASMPTLGRNAIPLLGELIARLGDGLPRSQVPPSARTFLAALLGEDTVAEAMAAGAGDAQVLLERAANLHPCLRHTVPALTGTTIAPTVLDAGVRLNVLPARASVLLDCRVLPGAMPAQVEADLRQRLGEGIAYELEWVDRFTAGTASPPSGPMIEAIQGWLDDVDPGSRVLPMICTGFTDSTHLRGAFGTAAYGFSPALVSDPLVLDNGYHNRDERIHVDDLTHAVAFHEELARRLLG